MMCSLMKKCAKLTAYIEMSSCTLCALDSKNVPSFGILMMVGGECSKIPPGSRFGDYGGHIVYDSHNFQTHQIMHAMYGSICTHYVSQFNLSSNFSPIWAHISRWWSYEHLYYIFTGLYKAGYTVWRHVESEVCKQFLYHSHEFYHIQWAMFKNNHYRVENVTPLHCLKSSVSISQTNHFAEIEYRIGQMQEDIW